MSEPRVWIAQCLCGPKRHAIMAASGMATDESDALAVLGKPLREQIEEAVRAGVVNPWCGLCGAGKDAWQYEVGRTRWRTLVEAAPHLQQAEAANIAASLLLGKRERPQ